MPRRSSNAWARRRAAPQPWGSCRKWRDRIRRDLGWSRGARFGVCFGNCIYGIYNIYKAFKVFWWLIRSLLECNFVWGGVVWVCDGFILILDKVTAGGRVRKYIIFLWWFVIFEIFEESIGWNSISGSFRIAKANPAWNPMHFYHQEDVGLQTCIGCGDQSETSDRRSSSWAEGSGLKPHIAIKLELATYVKGTNKHTNADVLDGRFFRGKEICVLFSSHFLWQFLLFFRLGNWLEWMPWCHAPPNARRRSCRWWFPSVCKICWRCFLRGLGIRGIQSLQGFRLTLTILKTKHVPRKFMVGRCNFLLKWSSFQGDMWIFGGVRYPYWYDERMQVGW